jgi:16S rRNA processing protein RimM
MVLDTGGAEIGRVHAIHDHGAGDMLEVICSGGDRAGRTALIPFTRVAVPTIDLARRRIVADPPAGTLDSNDDREEPET